MGEIDIIYDEHGGEVFEGNFVLVVAMYWRAPELLRQAGLLTNGTPKGDIYSFAIILWELMYNSKAGPYHDLNLEPKGEAEILETGHRPITFTFTPLDSLESPVLHGVFRQRSSEVDFLLPCVFWQI